MNGRAAAAVVLAGLLFAGGARVAGGQAANAPLDSAFSAFWTAENAEAAGEAAKKILGVTQDFAAVLDHLKAGRSYAAAPTGMILKQRTNRAGLVHPYFYVVPAKYDPAKKYAVRFYLHGGIGRPAGPANDPGWWRNYESLVRDDSIVVFPASWDASRWWDPSQIENIGAILDSLKRTYNVDENRAYLLGISDGATGIYYQGMLATTPWAGFLPFNGQPAVLANSASPNGATLYAANLADKPFFIVHGALDRLYPLPSVIPWYGLLEQAGVKATRHLKEQAGHDVRWWPEEAPLMDAFIQEHPRDPLPDAVTWEAGQTDRFNRAHWLVIDDIAAAASESVLPSPNEVIVRPIALNIGIRVWGEADGKGVQIIMVQPGSIADAYGMADGDIVREFGDDVVTNVKQLQAAFEANAATSVRIIIDRQGHRVPLGMQLPPSPAVNPRTAFPHPAVSGRVEVARAGNVVTVRTRGVRKYTLLLSPDRFDFSQPVKVVTNGATSFEGVVTPAAATLLKWAARDNDRTMLFGYELNVELPAAAAAPANR